MCKPAKVSQRAARKAAAACLARQRHKTFVNGLHDQSEALKTRVNLLNQRKQDMFGACAVAMIERLGEKLDETQMLQLQRWLMRSPKLAASLAAAATKASDAERGERVEQQHRPASPEPSASASGAQTPEPKTPSASASASNQIALDEELSKQAFVAEAMATMQSDAEDEDDSDAITEQEEWFGPMLHALELQEMWGDGLPVLLQHLSTSRQPSLQVWHQLKLEVESNDAAPATWTNLSMLEEDFVLMNHEHLHSSGFGRVSAVR